MPEDLPLIIADVLQTPQQSVLRIADYRVTVGSGQLPAAEVTVAYGGRTAKA